MAWTNYKKTYAAARSRYGSKFSGYASRARSGVRRYTGYASAYAKKKQTKNILIIAVVAVVGFFAFRWYKNRAI